MFYRSQLANIPTRNIVQRTHLRHLSVNTASKPVIYSQCSILKSNPLLVPQLTFTSQLKANLLRSFSTSAKLLDYYRPPKNNVYSGLTGRIWSRIPDSVKLISLVSISAYLVIFVAVPILVMVVPPLVVGGWLFYRLNKYFKTKSVNKAFQSIADSTLIYYPKKIRNPLLLPDPDQVNSELANFEMNRIIDAFWNNEKGIADYFKIPNIDDLALGTLEAVEINYNSTSVVFADDYKMMVTQRRPLYNKSTNEDIADVVIRLKCLENPIAEGLDPIANITKSLVQIEITPNNLFAPQFILKTPSVSTMPHDKDSDGFGDFDDDADGFINVKGKTKVL
ncbi:hypothetical protein BOH78_0176 [Pichia kudriavzevii]|uniref:Uncharacterized protein n=1 Tax=Pichia kudriavzevii TaxID=4909 RepID=A0A1V2LUF9_PICKU|nr:hypothetical protein BOH78_0176 [Pichia kudriavzevii]